MQVKDLVGCENCRFFVDCGSIYDQNGEETNGFCVADCEADCTNGYNCHSCAYRCYECYSDWCESFEPQDVTKLDDIPFDIEWVRGNAMRERIAAGLIARRVK